MAVAAYLARPAGWLRRLTKREPAFQFRGRVQNCTHRLCSQVLRDEAANDRCHYARHR